MPLFAWVMSGLDWYMKERRKGRREGASPFFRRPGARSAVVAEGAELWVAVEVMVIAVARSAHQDHRLVSFIIEFPVQKGIDQLNK